jgi:hypothetical protein
MCYFKQDESASKEFSSSYFSQSEDWLVSALAAPKAPESAPAYFCENSAASLDGSVFQDSTNTWRSGTTDSGKKNSQPRSVMGRSSPSLSVRLPFFFFYPCFFEHVYTSCSFYFCYFFSCLQINIPPHPNRVSITLANNKPICVFICMLCIYIYIHTYIHTHAYMQGT